MKEIADLLTKVSAAKTANAKAKASLQREVAPDFSPVELLAPGETALSKAFCWMLDEKESHGQGRAYRDLFVTMLFGGEKDLWEKATAECEVTTEDGAGRIDILMVSEDGKNRLVIENKPWAGWQDAQLSRYLGDQSRYDCNLHVFALIGSRDPEKELDAHWSANNQTPRPINITACDFYAVAQWLESSAEVTRPNHVREFLFGLANYCRRYVMGEPTASEIDDLITILEDGGTNTVKAAFDVWRGFLRACNLSVAKQVGGEVHKVNSVDVVQVKVGEVPLSFMLFGGGNPYAGVTEKQYESLMQGKADWATQTTWPRWAYLQDLGDAGNKLAKAVADNDLELVAKLIPDVGKVMLGSQKEVTE